MKRTGSLRVAFTALAILLCSTLAARAEITSVTLKTSRNVSFFWGSAISKLLRSQDGVNAVENPYGTLKQGLIKITARKDKPLDLARLVQVLEKNIGFEPVTEVALELRGRLVRREGQLFFEASGTGQTLAVVEVAGKAKSPPENQPLSALATLAQPRSGDHIILQRWSPDPGAGGEARETTPAPAGPARRATAELAITGMT